MTRRPHHICTVVFILVVWSSVMPNLAYAIPNLEDDAQSRVWTPGRQMALMTWARTDLTRAVVEKLKSSSTVRAGRNDYGFLIATGFAERKHGPRGQYFVLSRDGQARARNCARLVARSFDMHLPLYSEERYNATVRCTCGHFCGLARKGRNTTASLRIQYGHHLDRVKNGIFRPLSTLIDGIMADIGESGNKLGVDGDG